MTYYVQIEENTNKASGYSINKLNETDIEIIESETDPKFLVSPFLFKLNTETQKLEYSEELYKEYLERKNNKPQKPEDVLLKQIADIKLDSMNKDSIINNLVAQMAASKLENMNMKGSN